jgi:F0F1-type ATP synthase epsilon subunit
VRKGGIKISGTMTEYVGILSGIAEKTHQRSLDRERNRPTKEETERRNRKSKNEVRQKQIRAKDNSAKLRRKRK